MSGQLTAEVHFHSRQQASCITASSWQGPEAIRGELVLFACFANRQVVNLGPDYGATAGGMMSALHAPGFQGARICTPNGSMETQPVLLDKHPGSASMRFLSRITDEKFFLNAKGFGFLGTKILYYAPMSIAMLLQQLARGRSSDAKYICALEGILQKCSWNASSRMLNMANQKQLAFEAAFSAMESAGLLEH